MVTVHVRENRQAGKFTQTVSAGTHEWLADEPRGVGNDLGPSPYDLLLAALGTCTAMTLRLFADRRDFPLEEIQVELTHSRSHSEDCVDPAQRSCWVEEIDRVITLTGPLTDEQRRRLMEIADKCPVHRTLVGEVRIRTATG